MSHRRMKLLLISELILVIVLIALELLVPQARPYTLPLVLVVGTIQSIVITKSNKKKIKKFNAN